MEPLCPPQRWAGRGVEARPCREACPGRRGVSPGRSPKGAVRQEGQRVGKLGFLLSSSLVFFPFCVKVDVSDGLCWREKLNSIHPYWSAS